MFPPIKSHPDCKECQCYPECRMDCPDWRQCLERLPVYRQRCGLPPLDSAALDGPAKREGQDG